MFEFVIFIIAKVIFYNFIAQKYLFCNKIVTKNMLSLHCVFVVLDLRLWRLFAVR